MNKTSLKTLMIQNDKNDKKRCYCFTHGNQYVFANNCSMFVCNDNFDYTKLHDESIDNIIDKFTNNIDDYNIVIEVDIESLTKFYKSIKPRSKDNIGSHPTILTLTDDMKIGFNCKFLLDMLTAFKTNKIYCKNQYSPCFTNNDLTNDYGMLMPLLLPSQKG